MGFKAHFIDEMQRVREEVGLSRKQLAERMGTYKEPTIRSFENGYRTPTVALAVGLDKAYGTHGMFLAMQPQAEMDTSPFGELKESEQRAVSIRNWELGYVPGLLQTPRYAAAILTDPDDLDERIKRQQIFARDYPPYVHVIIGEGVLYNEIGGSVVLREQLEHLIAPNAPWMLQVMPFSAGSTTGVDGPFILLEFEGDEPPIAYFDSRAGGTVVDDTERIAVHWRKWERLAADALSPERSRAMIEEAIAKLPEV